MEHSLTAMDRCDRCRAPALVKTMHEAGPLLWCMHHYEKSRLNKDGVDILTGHLVLMLTVSDDVPAKATAR